MVRSLHVDSPSPGGQEPAWRNIIDQSSYGGFRDALARFDCRRCPLHGERQRIVVDRGHPAARVLFVGEGPGAEEDRQGRAFVGASGRLLDRMLQDAGIDPERDVLIANVVKCRPPGNRAPVQIEVNRCTPYLHRQIDLVRPRVVALLGATAVRHVLRPVSRKPMRDLVGRFFRWDARPATEIFVTYHPAYVLRYRKKMTEMVEHLTTVASRLRD